MILIIGSSIQSLCTLSKKFVKMQNFNQFLLMGWSERNALLTFQEQIRQLMKFNFSQFFFFFLLDYAPHCILQLQLTERDIVYTVNYTVYSTLVLEILEIYCTGHTYLRQVNYRETKLLKPTDKVILYTVYHKYSLNTTGSPLFVDLYNSLQYICTLCIVHTVHYTLYGQDPHTKASIFVDLYNKVFSRKVVLSSLQIFKF